MDKKVGKNIVLSMGYNILTIIVPFITAPYLARVLGADMVGAYTYIQSIASYFVMFGILGMRTYGNRTIARVRDNREKLSKTFWQIYAMQLLTGGITFVCYLVFILLSDIQNKEIAVIISIYVITSFTTIDWFCEGTEQFSSIAKRTLIIKVLNLIAIFAFVHSPQDVGIYAMIMFFYGLLFLSKLIL